MAATTIVVMARWDGATDHLRLSADRRPRAVARPTGVVEVSHGAHRTARRYDNTLALATAARWATRFATAPPPEYVAPAAGLALRVPPMRLFRAEDHDWGVLGGWYEDGRLRCVFVAHRWLPAAGNALHVLPYAVLEDDAAPEPQLPRAVLAAVRRHFTATPAGAVHHRSTHWTSHLAAFVAADGVRRGG